MALKRLQTDHFPVLRSMSIRRLVVIIAVVLVILALSAGGIAYALLSQDSTIVTITPASKVLSTTSTLSAVTGQPDPSKNQVKARMVSVTTPAQTKTVQASGHLSSQAMSARGTLELYNWDRLAPVTFQAGTVFSETGGNRVLLCPDSAGIEMVLDATVTVPPADQAKGASEVDAPAHVLEAGTTGNIPGDEGTFLLTGVGDAPCYYFLWVGKRCSGGWLGYCWTAEPDGQFTGGQDTYEGPVVQQSDIDTAAHTLVSASQPNPEEILHRQMKPGEHLIGVPQCTQQVDPGARAGDHVAQVTVLVFFTCTGEVYDQREAFAQVTRMLTAQASTDPGAGYALVGTIKTTLISVLFDVQGTARLTVEARGVWVYHFTDAAKQHLTRMLAGKSKQEALQLASNQPGVAYVTIHLPTGEQHLPADPTRMAVVVEAVPGA